MTKDRERHTISTLPTEIVLEILSKLPIKASHVCKCVSKTWFCLISEILTAKRSMQLPIHGLVFTLCVNPRDSRDPNFSAGDTKFFYAYLSLSDGRIRMRMSYDNDGAVRAPFHVTDRDSDDKSGVLLGDLTLDFGKLGDIGKDLNWSIHKGLLLAVPDGRTCHVCNPATKEVLVLPRSPIVEETDQPSKYVTERSAAIINLSGSSSFPAECRFMVVRFSIKRLLVEVYYSETAQWVSSPIKPKKTISSTYWSFMSIVFLNNTLFFLTDKTHIVAVKFTSEQTEVDGIPLPEPITKGFVCSTIGESQGCLYLTFHGPSELWIWKLGNCSAGVDAWIPILKSGQYGCLCKPIMKEAIRGALHRRRRTAPIAFDPNSSVVFIFSHPSIFAYNLLNDTLKKIADLDEKERVLGHFAVPYSPCLAPLKHQKSAHI